MNVLAVEAVLVSISFVQSFIKVCEEVSLHLLSFGLLEVDSSREGMSQIEFIQELSIYIDSKKKKWYFPQVFEDENASLMFKH